MEEDNKKMPKRHYLIFDNKGFEDYKSWLSQDKSKYKRIHMLIQSIQRCGPLEGEGKPEVLKGDYKGCYSRRIDEKNRLIYKYEKDDSSSSTIILGCADHYSGKENTEKQRLLNKLSLN